MHDFSIDLFEHDGDADGAATTWSAFKHLKWISIYDMAFIFDQQTNDRLKLKKKSRHQFSIE